MVGQHKHISITPHTVSAAKVSLIQAENEEQIPLYVSKACKYGLSSFVMAQCIRAICHFCRGSKSVRCTRFINPCAVLPSCIRKIPGSRTAISLQDRKRLSKKNETGCKKTADKCLQKKHLHAMEWRSISLACGMSCASISYVTRLDMRLQGYSLVHRRVPLLEGSAKKYTTVHVCYFRHTLALDDRRVKYSPEDVCRSPYTKSRLSEGHHIDTSIRYVS